MFKEMYTKVLMTLVSNIDLDSIPSPITNLQEYKDYTWDLTVKLRLCASVIAKDAVDHLNLLNDNGDLLN